MSTVPRRPPDNWVEVSCRHCEAHFLLDKREVERVTGGSASSGDEVCCYPCAAEHGVPPFEQLRPPTVVLLFFGAGHPVGAVPVPVKENVSRCLRRDTV